MLKRYQVLLNDWLADYIKFLCEKYDASFSEVIRLSLCMEYAYTITLSHPEYKTKLNHKKVVHEMDDLIKSERFLEENHKIISRTYFEARKAIEFALEKERKSKK